MKDLHGAIKTIASDVTEAVVMFSTGKDSIVTLDLCCQYLKKIKPVYLYSVPGLGYVNRFLQYYEKRYKVKIDQYPLPDVSKMFKNKALNNLKRNVEKIEYEDVELFLRKKYNISYIAYGYRKIESLQRRGQLTQCGNYDKKFKRLFPVSEWNDKDIFNYIKKKKLKLPPEYSHNMRDVNFFTDEALLWLKNIYPEDYAKVIRMYPQAEAEIVRLQV